MRPFSVVEGDGPLILGQPHGGTFVPDDLMARLDANGRGLTDTDWHIDRLYDGLLTDATVVRSRVHRYVIDANRDPGGASLYPGQNTTGLCPATDFDGRPIWRDGQVPSADEIEARREAYHAPYHAALAEQVERVRDRHGIVLVYDCHSIRSLIPFLFEGVLPVLNVGTNGGATCANEIEAAAARVCAGAGEFESVLNGRFKGGWTTRHYGRPEAGVHAIQMEVAQRAYMDEAPPWGWRDDRAGRLRPVLGNVLKALAETVEGLRRG